MELLAETLHLPSQAVALGGDVDGVPQRDKDRRTVGQHSMGTHGLVEAVQR